MFRPLALFGLIPDRPGGRARPSASVSAAQQEYLLELVRLEAVAALARLDSGMDGLDAGEAAERLERHGPNVVGSEQRESLLVEILHRLVNPLNLLLLALAVVSFITSDPIGAGIMTTMVTVAVIVGYVQERKSSQAVASLRRMVSNTASVRRRGGHGARSELPIEQLVPGDVIHLSAGDMLPADARLLAAKDLFVNQSSLTGESMPVEKFAGADAAARSPLEARNLCFMGS
ncbi:MAG: magnesium-translocating P-type ATPase, partial [Xanthomonadaceae bacterium]|nr:magnesium-translocating P-type ATPase [Xanthomonadaceae bacterium]